MGMLILIKNVSAGKVNQQTSDRCCFCRYWENSHLAFNDPPADFETEEAYLVVALNDACRRQQLGEGWFPTINDVPEKAISMSIKQIMNQKPSSAAFLICEKLKQLKRLLKVQYHRQFLLRSCVSMMLPGLSR